MGKSVNKVILLGHLGRDPEVKSLPSGLIVATFSIATTERRKKGDKYEEFPEWHRITAFGKLAEIVRDYVKKGNKIYIEGRLRTQSWDDNGTKRFSTDIVAEDVTLLSSPQGQSQGQHYPPANNAPAGSFDSYATTAPQPDDDIPF